MEDQKILYEVKDKIAWVTLNRPESLNAVNREMVKSIVGYCREAEEDPNVQVVIFKANGERAFSVGGDIKDRARLNAASAEPAESPLVLRQTKHTGIPGTPAPAIAAMNKITIALLHGYTVGTGLLMSLACDIRIAAEGARLGVSEVRLGFMAGSGGTQRMARLVGIPKALEICLSGELYDAQRVLPNRPCESARSLRSIDSGGGENGGFVLERRAAGAALYQRSDLQRQRDDLGAGITV